MAMKTEENHHIEEALAMAVVDSEIEVQVHLKTWIVVIVSHNTMEPRQLSRHSNQLDIDCFVQQSICFLYFAQLVAIVGSGFLALYITQLLGIPESRVWPAAVITISGAAMGPPISQASDYWGRKWFLVSLNMLGFVGALIISRAESGTVVLVGFVVLGLHNGSQPLLHAVVSEVLPRKHRPWAQVLPSAGSSDSRWEGLWLIKAISIASGSISTSLLPYGSSHASESWSAITLHPAASEIGTPT